MEKIFYRKKNINFLLPDGIHLNNEGVKIYSEKISNFLIKKINEKNL